MWWTCWKAWASKRQRKTGMIDNHKFWEARAAEARAVADKLSDPSSRQYMLHIASVYDRLAERAKAHSEPEDEPPQSK